MTIVLIFCAGPVAAQSAIADSKETQTIEIHDAPEMEVIAVSKNVVIHKDAKEVFVFGGDVIIEGRVEGDVGVIGGSVIQKEGSYIGGDVIVFGGEYRFEGERPGRADGKQTIVYGILEEELRDLGRNPAQILSPSMTPAFLAQRLLSVLFWFVVTLIVTTMAPGAVSRAVARLRLSPAKVSGLGLAGLIAAMLVMSVSVSLLPDYLSTMAGLMIFGLMMLAYLFGRVALQLSVGKHALKFIFRNSSQNETFSILIGVVIITLLLSLPYVWALALLALFAIGVGLVLTARAGSSPRSG